MALVTERVERRAPGRADVLEHEVALLRRRLDEARRELAAAHAQFSALLAEIRDGLARDGARRSVARSPVSESSRGAGVGAQAGAEQGVLSDRAPAPTSGRAQ